MLNASLDSYKRKTPSPFFSLKPSIKLETHTEDTESQILVIDIAEMMKSVASSKSALILLLLAVILVSMSTDAAACNPIGVNCYYPDAECCAGSRCKTYVTPEGVYSACEWCPGPGLTCGFLDPCCPGYSCDGFFSGTCS